VFSVDEGERRGQGDGGGQDSVHVPTAAQQDLPAGPQGQVSYLGEEAGPVLVNPQGLAQDVQNLSDCKQRSVPQISNSSSVCMQKN